MKKLLTGLLAAVALVAGMLAAAIPASAAPAPGLWTTEAPLVQDYVDGRSINLGMKFKANKPGAVTGIKFYKGAKNVGAHTGALWSSTGVKLAAVTFSNESPSGWQTAALPAPVALVVGRTYTVSYKSPLGIFARDAGYFSGRTIDSADGALSTVAGSTGSYRYGSSDAFPTSSRGDANYWVDVAFQADAPAVITPAPDPVIVPPPAPTPGMVCPSNGTGGGFTDQLNQSFTAPDGATSQFHIYAAGIDQSKPVGVVVQLHGDGAYEFGRPTAGKLLAMSAIAEQRNMILISVKSPDRSGSVTWWENPSVNVPFLQSLLETQVYGKYNIEKNRVWLSGYSGGAEFISLYYVKRQHQTFCGGGALISGGGSVTQASPTIPFTQGFKDSFKLHFYTGQDDGAGSPISFNGFQAAQTGAAQWRDRGFNVSTEFPAGIDHYELDEPKVLSEQLAKVYPLATS